MAPRPDAAQIALLPCNHAGSSYACDDVTGTSASVARIGGHELVDRSRVWIRMRVADQISRNQARLRAIAYLNERCNCRVT